MRFNRRDVQEYCLINEMAGMIPMPEATTTKFSLSIAGDLKGYRNGPTTNAGLCVGVVIVFISFCVQSPHLSMHIEEWLGLVEGKTVNAWN